MLNNQTGTKLRIVIGRGFSVILLLTLITGIFGINSLQRTNDDYENLLNGAVKLDEYSLRIILDLNAARHIELLILNTGNESLKSTHDVHMDKIIYSTSSILSINYDNYTNKIALDIKEDIIVYDYLVDIIFGLYKSRGGSGYGLDAGILGDLRLGAYNVDMKIQSDYKNGILNKTQFSELDRLYLDIRKDEKDYLLKRKVNDDWDDYISELTIKILEFGNQINSYDIGSENINLYNSLWAEYNSTINLLLDIDALIEIKLPEFDELGSKVVKNADTLKKYAKTIVIAVNSDVSEHVVSIQRLMMMVVIITIILGILLISIIVRSIIEPIAKLEEDVSVIANGDLSSTLEFEKKPSHEIFSLSSNVNIMKNSLKDFISSVSLSNQILNSTSEDLLSGAEEINASSEEVANTSQAMSDGASSQTELIAEINENINELQLIVADIVKKIQLNTQEVSQIALQTNILALNAGIEASRAGDYGRGFAVVAENVRKLSDQSKLASERIATVAEEIQDRLQKSFFHISNTILNVVSVSEETAASSEEVAAAAEEMSSTIAELSSLAMELNSQAVSSAKLISKYIIRK